MNAGGSPEARRADGADSTDAPDGARLTWGMRRWKGGSVARRPGLVIAGRARAAALREGRTGRPIGERRAGQIRPVRLLPFPWRIAFLSRRYVDGVMHPAMPGRRDGRGLGIAVVDDPAPLKAERGIDLATLGAEITVAELVGADR